MLKAMVVVDENWGIGCENCLLAHLPNDLKRFKETTSNEFIIMGRKTLESLPNGEPLPNRVNIILTRDRAYINDKVIIVHSIDEVLNLIKILKQSIPKSDFIVCGGGQIYESLFPYIEKILVTKINHTFKNVDTFFRNLDLEQDWLPTLLEFNAEDNGYSTDLIRYERK